MMQYSIFDYHHQVLQAWADYRLKSDKAPIVLTLDYHTDTLPAFGRHFSGQEQERQKYVRSIDYRNAEDIQQAIRLLQHDEHLDLAVQCGIVSESIVISHYPPALPPCQGIRTVSPDWPDQNILLNDAAVARPLADSVLEDSFLSAMLKKADFVPEKNFGFILDIDLDYFLTLKGMHPVQNGIWKGLVKNAGLITISREDDWIRLLRLDSELNSEKLLNDGGTAKSTNAGF